MTSLNITVEAPTWTDRVVGRADQARRSRLAALLKDLAVCIEQGRTEGTIERPDLVATYTLELPNAGAAAAA